MRNFAIRPISTGLLAVSTKPRLLSRLAWAAAIALSMLHVSDGYAAEHKGRPAATSAQATLANTIKTQLRFAATDDKALLQAWYGARSFSPIWVTPNGLTIQGKAAIQALSQTANEGLPPARYDLSALTTATSARSLPSQAELEVAISIAVQTYLHDLRFGAANPTAQSFGVEGLTAVEKHGFNKAVADARPANPRYGQLSNQLKSARSVKEIGENAKTQMKETILALEKLRWEQSNGKAGASFASLTDTVRQ